MNEVRIAGVVKESIVDGDGIRFVLFVQGCPHNCEGCHNPNTHDFNGGKNVPINSVLSEFKKNPLVSGITFSGGEPFCQPKPLFELAKEIKNLKKNIWIYTGYKFEDLLLMSKDNEDVYNLIHIADVLVDGKFILKEKSLTIRYRGSKNQRLIDLKKTFKMNDEKIYTFE